MIHTHITTFMVALVISAPIINGAESKPKTRIPTLAIQPQVVDEEIVVAPGVHDKTLLWQRDPKAHIYQLPFHEKIAEKVTAKNLLWRPNEGEEFIYALDSTEELPAGPWLGVHVTEVSALVASQLGLTLGMGLAVEHVVPDSPAAKAGLKQHDILTKFEDQSLINPKQLIVLVRSKEAGEEVKLTFIRGGETHVTTTHITDRSASDVRSHSYHIQNEDEDIVLEVGSDPLVVDRRIVEKMNPIEKGVLASAMAKGKTTQLKKGMHTSLFFVDNTNLVLSDDSGTYNLRSIDGKKRLVVLNPEGDTIYKGDLDDEQSIEALPEGIREKVKEMTGHNKTDHLMRFYKKVETDRHEAVDPTAPHQEETILIEKHPSHE